MARAPVVAAGGIVLRQDQTSLIAVVRLRKRNEWVLPKGKLDDGETPRVAAEREVLEETGHDVSVHEYLGTLVYQSGGRSKVVHYWRMQASGEQVYELMDDVTAVDWLPLEAAVERLSRAYERAFLANVGPLALEAAMAAQLARRPKAKQPALGKRVRRKLAKPSFTAPALAPPQPDAAEPAIGHERSAVAIDVVETKTSVSRPEREMTLPLMEGDAAPAAGAGSVTTDTIGDRRASVLQKVRDWLRRII